MCTFADTQFPASNLSCRIRPRILYTWTPHAIERHFVPEGIFVCVCILYRAHAFFLPGTLCERRRFHYLPKLAHSTLFFFVLLYRCSFAFIYRFVVVFLYFWYCNGIFCCRLHSWAVWKNFRWSFLIDLIDMLNEVTWFSRFFFRATELTFICIFSDFGLKVWKISR